ncbi:unnamed protein product [Polarella glacialis]|uniref:Amine oxidase domain-containing protein n=2 Tax=Polarella glacialis TaxID=89957 RepID=A0A813IT99_POLGL|nr:unnamed protein product [Polarella glacialis]
MSAAGRSPVHAAFVSAPCSSIPPAADTLAFRGHARHISKHPAAVAGELSPTVARSSVRGPLHRSSALCLAGVVAPLLSNARRNRLSRQGRAKAKAKVALLQAGQAGGRGKKILIVGGGIGGLSSAAQLAKQGFDVTLFEKNEDVGGRVQSLTRSGFRWDAGPSLLLLPKKYEECFARAGVDMKDHLTLRRADPAYRVVFGDNTSLDLLYDMQKMSDQLEAFEPGAKTKYAGFLDLARKMYEMGIDQFIDKPFSTWGELIDLPELLPKLVDRGWWTLPFLDIAGPYDLLLKKFFKDPRIRSIFSFQTMYVGLTPYRAPGAFCLLAGTELTDGVWYPLGGFQGIGGEMAKVAVKNGVKMRTGTAVDEVVVENGVAVGLRLEGSSEVIRGDAVLVNADLTYAYTHLLKGADANLPRSAGEATSSATPVADFGEYWHKKTFASGVISFLFAFDVEVPRLLQHTVFVGAPDCERQAWQPVSRPEGIAKSPNFYVHTPSKTDPSAAPEGQDSVMILFPVANMQEMEKDGFDMSKPGAYKELTAACRAVIFRRFREAGCGDLEAHLVDEVIRDPQEWKELYNLDHGAAFGLSCGLLQLAMTRPPPKDENGVEGLYFTGASTRPGNGVPLVMMGAGLVANQIAQDFGVEAVNNQGHEGPSKDSAWAAGRPTACEGVPLQGQMPEAHAANTTHSTALEAAAADVVAKSMRQDA